MDSIFPLPNKVYNLLVEKGCSIHHTDNDPQGSDISVMGDRFTALPPG